MLLKHGGVATEAPGRRNLADTVAERRVVMGTNRIGIGDGDPSSKQRSKRRTSVAPECTVCKPHEPTEEETRMSTLCQAALDNDPGEYRRSAACSMQREMDAETIVFADGW